MTLFKHSRDDLFRYCRSRSNRALFLAFKYPGFTFFFFFRKIQMVSVKNPIWFFYRMILWFLSYRFGFQIPHTTSIGRGLHIAHFGTIIINGKAIIGDNCNISPNVVIGQTNRGEMKGTPKIGNKVWIGTGSVIVGGITIGNNVLIAPNSYVNINIPDNSIVIGNPLKIIKNDNATLDYIHNAV